MVVDREIELNFKKELALFAKADEKDATPKEKEIYDQLNEYLRTKSECIDKWID